jgi:hypothetical protein
MNLELPLQTTANMPLAPDHQLQAIPIALVRVATLNGLSVGF